MQAVGILARVDPLQRGVLVQLTPWQRQLHDVAGALRIGVELVDGLVEGGLAGVGGQVAPDRGDADFRAIGVLAPHVGVRTRVVAHQHRAQPRRAARGGQHRDPLGEVDEDLVARGFTVQRDRTHGPQSGMLTRTTGQLMCSPPPSSAR